MLPMTTQRLVLRPLRLEDATGVFAYASDPEVTHYLPWETHQTLEDSKAFIAHAQSMKDDPFNNLALCLKDTPDSLIGVVCLRRGAHEFSAELAYALSQQYWRHGFMYEACSALRNMAFGDLGYKRLSATCAKENIASKSLMKKLGMQFEGCLRASTYRKNTLWDIEYYAILEDDWRALKGND